MITPEGMYYMMNFTQGPVFHVKSAVGPTIYQHFQKQVKIRHFGKIDEKPTFKARFTVQNTPKMALPDIPLGPINIM